jgi:hypothetical protein
MSIAIAIEKENASENGELRKPWNDEISKELNSLAFNPPSYHAYRRII